MLLLPLSESISCTKCSNIRKKYGRNASHFNIYVIKTEYRSAVMSERLKYNPQREPYSMTIAKYMNQKFNNDGNEYKFDRYFYYVPTLSME